MYDNVDEIIYFESNIMNKNFEGNFDLELFEKVQLNLKNIKS